MLYPDLSRHALVAGACALVPLPFVDMLFRRVVLRRAYEDISRHHGLELSDPALGALLRERTNLLLGCLVAAIWWPIKKLFRTLIFVLLVKDALDWAAEAAVRGLMVQAAAARGLLPARAEAVSAAMDQCVRAHLGSPVWGIARGRSADPVPWPDTTDAVDLAVRGLACHAGGAAALAAFDEALDRLPAAALGAPDTPDARS